jgi:hypothetical protein
MPPTNATPSRRSVEMSEKANRIEIQLIPLERMAEPIFDLSQLPFAITPGVEVADVSSLMPPSDFEYMKEEVGRHQLHYFTANVKYGLVHRYGLPTMDEDDASKNKSELLNNIFALLRLIRPHRRQGGVNGDIVDGKPHFTGTTFPHSTLDVPEAVKLFAVRNKDLEELRNLLPTFLKAMQGAYWPFRMAVQYYYMGYEVNDWKGRYLYWGSSALHALYSHKEHKIVPRVKAFLGENTLIYEPKEHPDFEFLTPNPITIKDVLDDVNEVRNDIAHGDKIPDRFFAPGGGRQTLNGVVNYLAVLEDALSFIIRESLLRILRNNLVEDFKDRHHYSLYWKTLGV